MAGFASSRTSVVVPAGVSGEWGGALATKSWGAVKGDMITPSEGPAQAVRIETDKMIVIKSTNGLQDITPPWIWEYPRAFIYKYYSILMSRFQ
jgi:hypothetical protein